MLRRLSLAGRVYKMIPGGLLCHIQWYIEFSVHASYKTSVINFINNAHSYIMLLITETTNSVVRT